MQYLTAHQSPSRWRVVDTRVGLKTWPIVNSCVYYYETYSMNSLFYSDEVSVGELAYEKKVEKMLFPKTETRFSHESNLFSIVAEVKKTVSILMVFVFGVNNVPTNGIGDLTTECSVAQTHVLRQGKPLIFDRSPVPKPVTIILQPADRNRSGT